MAVFRTSPLYPSLAHRKSEDRAAPTGPIPPPGSDGGAADPARMNLSLSAQQHAATTANPTIYETALLQKTLRVQSGARELFRDLPDTMPLDTKLLVLEARLDALYKDCEAAVGLQGQLLSWIIAFASSPSIVDPADPAAPGALKEHIIAHAHKFQGQWLHVVAQMMLTYNALFFDIRGPLARGVPASVRGGTRCQELLRRVEQAEKYLLEYDIYCNYPMGELLGILAGTLPNESLNPADRGCFHRKRKPHHNYVFRRLLYGLTRRRRVPPDRKFLEIMENRPQPPRSLASYLYPTSIHACILNDGWLTRGNNYREYIYALNNNNILDGPFDTASVDWGDAGEMEDEDSDEEYGVGDLDYDTEDSGGVEDSDEEYRIGNLDYGSEDSGEATGVADEDSSEEYEVENLGDEQDQESEPFAPSQGWPYIPPLDYGDEEDPGVID